MKMDVIPKFIGLLICTFFAFYLTFINALATKSNDFLVNEIECALSDSFIMHAVLFLHASSSLMKLLLDCPFSSLPWQLSRPLGFDALAIDQAVFWIHRRCHSMVAHQ